MNVEIAESLASGQMEVVNKNQQNIYRRLNIIGKKLNENTSINELYKIFTKFVSIDLIFEKCFILKYDEKKLNFYITQSYAYNDSDDTKYKNITLDDKSEIISSLKLNNNSIIHTQINKNKIVERFAESLGLDECYLELLGGTVDKPYCLTIVGNAKTKSGSLFTRVDKDPMITLFLSSLTLQISNAINNTLFYEAYTNEKKDLENKIAIRTKEITEQKEAFEAMYFTSKEAIAILDMDTKFLSANSAYCELTGFNESELLKLSCRELTIDKDKDISENAIAEVKKYGYIKSFTKNCIVKGGKVVSVEMSMSLLKNPQRILVSARDVTLSLELTQRLKESNKEALSLIKSKSEFFANISHEIRTPMNGIIGMSYLALQTNLNEQQSEYIKKISASSKTLLRIINDILDFSKLEAGKINIEKIPFKIKEIIDSSVNLIEYQLQEKNLNYEINYAENLSPMLYGDPLRLTQVLTNLLSNAVKFTQEGKLEINISKVNDTYSFEVKDTGIGLDKLAQKNLFVPFSQADGSITRKYGGTGLGLSIVKQLIEAMDGTISVKSKPGIGTSFIVSIDFHEFNELPKEEVEKKDISVLAGNTILLAEDNNINRDVFASLLAASGIHIENAYNGAIALEKYSQNPTKYDMILLDIQMPVLNGYETSEQIRKINKEIPIIAISANSEKEDKNKSKKYGMDAYISKPIDIDVLFEVLLKYMKPKFVLNNLKSIGKDKVNKPINIKNYYFKSIDTELGLKHLANNEKYYYKILEEFFHSYGIFNINDIKESEYEYVIHTLKGISGTIGAKNLFEIIKKLEKEKSLDNINQFSSELSLVIEELKIVFKHKPKKIVLKQKVALQYLDKLFRLLKESVITQRPKNCKYVLSEIEKYELTDEYSNILIKAREMISQYKFQELEKLLEEI